MSFPEHATIRAAARRVAVGADSAREAYANGRVPDEPRLVERTLTEIENAVRGDRLNGLTWTASSLTSIGPQAAESRLGADFVGVFEVQLPDFSVTKGFLAQAKLIRDHSLDARERKRLREQCQRMLSYTPDAFVWLFSAHDIRIVPAISVVAGDNDPSLLYDRSVSRFFEEHFACFIGDREIRVAAASGAIQLPELMQRYEVGNGLYLGVGS